RHTRFSRDWSSDVCSSDLFYEIKEELISRGYDLRANDTICRQVSSRYEDLGSFAEKFDKIVFVSGKKSSNGKVLYDVCLKSNPNTYFISDPADLTPEMFEKNDRVGSCGATSTLMWLMEKVRDVLQQY